MRLFRFLLRNSRSAVVLTLFFGAVSGALNTLLIAMINTALGDSNQPGFLMWGFAGLCLMLPLTRFVSETLISNLGQDSLYRLRIQLSEQIVATPLRKLEELSAPRLLAALTDDLLVVTAAIYAVPTVSMNAAIVCGGLLYMGWLSPTLFLTVLVFVVIGVITYYVPAKRSLNSIKLAREEGDSLFKHFRSLIEGVKELKLHEGRRAGFLSDVLRPTARAFRRHNVRGMSTYAAANSLGQTLVFALLGLLIFVTPDATGAGAQTLTGYAMILLYIMIPFQLIMNTLPLLGRAEVALRKVEQLGLSPATGSGEAGAARAHGLRGVERLDLVDVTHTYYHDDRHSGEGNMFTLGPINLTFYPGELVFLVGGNGSGKTTLAKLFAGLYSPESGEILVNGVPVTEENREGYRQLFSAVFSDFHLFEKLHVLDSAELGERALEHLARLHLDHKVQIRDGAFSTTALSQGQRKRLALLTTYLEDRPVYVFDEWAADQDPLFKDVFYNELLPELKARGKIVLVISHDDKYYPVGDRVIKLDYGQVNCVEPHLAGAAANG